jgi:hypothetical protein
MGTDDSLDVKASFYPGSTEIEGQVSIFLLGFRHSVSIVNVEDWSGRVERLGWVPHPYFRADPGASHICCDGRLFGPHLVLTPTALTTVLGATWGRDGQASTASSRALYRARLSSEEGSVKHVENLLLTRDASRCPWIGQPLSAKLPSGDSVSFVIEWADLWLFDDEAGIIALKTRIDGVASTGGVGRRPTLSDIGAFHRYLRDWQDPSVTVARAADPASESCFWEGVVFNRWMGTEEPGQHLLMRDGEASRAVFDGCSRYCKLLTGVQVKEIEPEAELAWSSPISDPLGRYPYQRHADELESGMVGNALLAYQAASLAGYPTYRDLFLLELATTSDEGAAGGRDGIRGWQYNMDYVKRLLDEGGIAIWEYWKGLALRDVCAFVAWSDSMPLIKRDQLEARYYPLYVHAYHLRHELDGIAASCVDHDLVEVHRLRVQLRRFETFRSRYWFKEVTRDFQGVEVFRRMKQGMEVDELFETVSDEVKEVSDYLEGMSDRGRQALVALAIAAAYPLYAWYRHASQSPVGERLLARYGETVTAHPLLTLGITIVGTVVLALVFVRLWTRWAPRIARVLQRVYARLARERL